MSSRVDIKRQIEELQAKLAQQPESPPTKRRKVDDSKVLAPATPSPKKKRNDRPNREVSPTPGTRRSQQPRAPLLGGNSKTNSGYAHKLGSSHYVPSKVAEPSAFFSELKSMGVNRKEDHNPLTRTEGFSEKPVPQAERCDALNRDDNLAIIEELEPGPVEHKPIADDPQFKRFEPNSGIRLKQRVLSHDALQDHLTGRYFLPPSLLYSVVRLESNKQAYEVPVYGDWVTIAVVAERGDVRHTNGPGNAPQGKRGGGEEFDEEKPERKDQKKAGGNKGKMGNDVDDERKGSKKYVHLKMIDLGTRSRSSSSSAPRATLRGDAQLSLLLFESDHYDKLISTENGKKREEKIWRGGSGGAFEECFSKLREGTVVALLNPKVLKPYQNTKNPSNSSILALTPPSASAIAIVGYALDLGLCTVVKRDGKSCRAWVDKRTGSGKPGEDVCEYHIQHAVQRARASRPEFAIGTSGMSTTAVKNRPAYDPRRQWGLKPEGPSKGADGETMYVIGGHVASSSSARGMQAPGVVAEAIGREGQARARRKDAKREDEALKMLLSRAKGNGPMRNSGDEGDGGGGISMSRDALEVVRRAKEAMRTKEKQQQKKAVERKQKRKGGTTVDVESAADGESEPESEFTEDQQRKKLYSAEMIKRLGFNPLSVQAHRSGQESTKKKPAAKLDGDHTKTREVQLGPPPGAKVRSGVKAPGLAPNSEPIGAERKSTGSSSIHSKCESDSDLEIEPPAES